MMITTNDVQDHRRRIALMVGIAVASVGLWQTQVGGMVLYPFTILATWFHEMGHGLAALLTGSRFDHLMIFSDGSGYASFLRPVDGWRITGALIAAAGPLGPAVAGSLLIVASRTPESSRRALMWLGGSLMLSTFIWVRSLTGWLLLPFIAGAILGISAWGSPATRRFAVQLLGVQACISVWRQFDYLFSSGGSVGGRLERSDTAAMQDALLLPYWFWGAAISLVIVAMLWISLRSTLRR